MFRRIFPFIALTAGMVFLATIGGAVAQENTEMSCPPLEGSAEPLPEATLYIEYNATDGDLGVHGLFSQDGWVMLCLYNPAGTEILRVVPQAEIRDQYMADTFFEAAEPPLSELGFEQFYTRFPEGGYEVRLLTGDGTVMSSSVTFTHAVPAAPVIVAPAVASEEDAEVISVDKLVVQWEPVTQTVDGNPVNIVGYQVIITNDDYEDQNPLARPVFDVHVPSDRTSLTISPEFFQPDTLYELEILALEESGNQTIALGFFMTGDNLEGAN